MYLFNEMHTNMEHIAVPHPPQFANWGTFPPGEGIALRYLYKFQFIGLPGKTDMHIFLIIPGGDTTSYISYLISRICVPCAFGDRKVTVPAAKGCRRFL